MYESIPAKPLWLSAHPLAPWAILSVLEKSELLGFPDFSGARYEGRALFVHGERSAYVAPAHHAVIRHLFPRAEIVAIEQAGHWLHVDQPVRFLETVQAFFRSDGS